MTERRSLDVGRPSPPQLLPRQNPEKKGKLSRKMVPPSAHGKFSRLKQSLAGLSSSDGQPPVPAKEPVSDAQKSLARQASINVRRGSSPGHHGKDTITLVSPSVEERTAPMTTSLAPPKPQGESDPASPDGEAEDVDVLKLQKDLKRARLEVVQAQAARQKAESDLKLYIMDLENGLGVSKSQGQPRAATQAQQVNPDMNEFETLKSNFSRKSEECEELNSRLAETHQQLQEMTRTSVEGNQPRFSTLHEQNRQLMRDLAESQSNFNEQESRCHSLQQELVETKQQVQRLEMELGRVENASSGAASEAKRARNELNRLVQQVASATPTVDVYYSDDVYFKNQFGILRGTVKDWANKAFSAYTSKQGRKISVALTHQFNSISQDWDMYMESDEHRPAFVQAFVWNYLLSRVFGSKFWESSSTSQPYGMLLEEYQNSKKDDPDYEKLQKLYHEWRSAGAKLAAPIGTENQVVNNYAMARVAGVVRSLSEPLETWCTMGKTQSNDSLTKIVIDAVLLDLKMQQQRAFFFLLGAKEVWDMKEGRYDSSTMEVRFGKLSKTQKDQYLVLLMAPLMSKRGNSDGEGYRTSIVIEKAQVDIELPKKKRQYLGVT